MSTRQPYPFPKLESDNDFVGSRYEQQKSYGLPIHLAQKKDPWNRLNNTATLSSSRREVYHHDTEAPSDSLDFVLKTEYDHHKEFMKDKSATLIQPETIGKEHGRILKNRTVMLSPEDPKLGHPLRMAVNPKKECLDSIDVPIEGCHTQTTNRGYSRKPDGGFFTS